MPLVIKKGDRNDRNPEKSIASGIKWDKITMNNVLQNYMVSYIKHNYKLKVMCTVYVLEMLQNFASLFHRVAATDDKG